MDNFRSGYKHTIYVQNNPNMGDPIVSWFKPTNGDRYFRLSYEFEQYYDKKRSYEITFYALMNSFNDTLIQISQTNDWSLRDNQEVRVIKFKTPVLASHSSTINVTKTDKLVDLARKYPNVSADGIREIALVELRLKRNEKKRKDIQASIAKLENEINKIDQYIEKDQKRIIAIHAGDSPQQTINDLEPADNDKNNENYENESNNESENNSGSECEKISEPDNNTCSNHSENLEESVEQESNNNNDNDNNDDNDNN